MKKQAPSMEEWQINIHAHVYSYHRKLYTLKKKINDIHYNMNSFHKYYVQPKKLNRKEYTWSSLHEIKKRQN